MLSRLNETQKGILIAITGFAAFVGSDSCSKWLAGHYSVFQVVAVEYLIALAFCLLGAPFLGGFRKTLQTPKLKFHLARAIANFGLAVSVVYAFQKLPLTTVYPVLFLSPFIMTLLAGYFYKESVRLTDWVVILIGFSGVLVAFRPGFEILDPWLFVALLSTFFIAVFGLLARPLGEDETLASLALYPSLGNVIFLSPFMFETNIAPAHFPVFIFSGLCVCFGMICIACAYRITRYAVVSPLQYLQLVLAFIVGYIVFDEHPDLWMMTGSLIIVASGILLTVIHKKS